MKKFIAAIVIFTTVYTLMVLAIIGNEELTSNDRFGCITIGATLIVGAASLLAIDGEWFEEEKNSRKSW